MWTSASYKQTEKSEYKLSDTFFTEVPNVQNLTTSIIKLCWKFAMKFLSKNAFLSTTVENLIHFCTTWIYFLFGIVIYRTHKFKQRLSDNSVMMETP